jgi:cytochrome c-type biogenesis protein CcsB
MRDTLVKEMSSIKKTDSKKRELIKVIQRLDSYNDIVSGLSWTIPEEVGGQWLWTAMPQGLTETKVMAFKDPAKDLWFPFFAYFDHLKARYEASEGKKHIIEYYYSSLKPFSWNLLLGLMALGALFIFPSTKRPVLILTFLSLALQVLAIATRVYISGRAPITNMYETVAFSGFGALCMGSILWFKSKNSIYLVAGLFYNMLCMMMIQFAVSMLSPSIAPLVPSLRDNFWLSTHVTSVILSYAALALSWILANLVLMGHFTKAQFFSSYRGPATLKLMDQCMKVGVILLSTGIILGGIWADYSWGRFWGWDPKETGSLIVLLVYIAILHGRKTNLISNAQFAPITAGAFLSVMMAWFGVNYILASGLHTYGFSEGGALFLSLFTLIQLSLISFYYLKKAAAKVIP